MRFFSMRQMRQSSSELRKQLRENREIILTSNGKPIAFMTEVDETNVEKVVDAFRRAKAAIALEEMQRRSREAGTDTLSEEEIEAEIEAVRKTRRP